MPDGRTRTRLRAGCTLAALAGVAGVVGACGSKQIEVPKNDPTRAGAQLFADRCSGCHTLDAAATQGSSGGQKIVGPNFNYRKETVDSVLYAIRNGGFSRGLMPSNIVVGEQAEQVSEFVARWSGKKAPPELAPGAGSTQPGGKTSP